MGYNELPVRSFLNGFSAPSTGCACVEPESTIARSVPTWHLTRVLYTPGPEEVAGGPVTWNTHLISISGHSQWTCPSRNSSTPAPTNVLLSLRDAREPTQGEASLHVGAIKCWQPVHYSCWLQWDHTGSPPLGPDKSTCCQLRLPHQLPRRQVILSQYHMKMDPVPLFPL